VVAYIQGFQSFTFDMVTILRSPLSTALDFKIFSNKIFASIYYRRPMMF